MRGQRSRWRYDVWTDAGRAEGAATYLLMEDLSPSVALPLAAALRRRGWKVDLIGGQSDQLETPRPSYRGTRPGG